jgi:hypothetical protein
MFDTLFECRGSKGSTNLVVLMRQRLLSLKKRVESTSEFPLIHYRKKGQIDSNLRKGGKCSHLRVFTNSKMWSYNATTLGIVDAANLTMTHSQNPVFQHLLILQWELAATNVG